eukprot:CAMPEP_0194068160 /NCGR_PEP_ID=MMETSP0009_2-20130614/86942_1 /TAXON_ID=210454 /ORGANISM="Grammatophora oceanica, Strain CCMP 410" /LENGTH=119 /DNA_ID=CAMNT_0038721229 /DNA_START=687 /DNA_END=1046 /DNA_ORIENTATION=-
MWCGTQILSLMAEAGYDTIHGPAADVHLARFTLGMGVGCPLLVKNKDAYVEGIKLTYGKEQWPLVNEVPATLGQLLVKLGNESSQQLANMVVDLGVRHDFHNEIKGVVYNYVPSAMLGW